MIGRIISKNLPLPAGYTFSLKDVETNLLSRVQVRQITIDYPDGSQFLTLKYGALYYHVFDLVKGNISLRSLHLDSLHCTIKRDSTGKILLPASSSPNQNRDRKDIAAVQILIKNIHILHSSISYQDQKIPLSCTLHDIKFNWSKGQNQDISFRFSSDSGKVVYRNKDFHLGQTSLTGDIRSDCWRIPEFTTRCAGLLCTGKAEGKRSIPSDFRGNLSLQGPVQAFTALIPSSLLPGLTPLTGKVNAVIQLEKNKKATGYKSTVDFRNVKLGYLSLVQAFFQADWQDSLLRLNNLEISLSGGQISAKGFLETGSRLNHHLTLRMNDLQLKDLSGIISQESSALQGLLNGSLVSSGPLASLKDLQIDSQLNLTKTNYENMPVPDINMKLLVNTGSASLRVNQAENTLQSQWQFESEKIKGAYTLHLPRIEYIAGLLPLSDLRGSIRAEGEINGFMLDPDISAQIRGEAITLHTIPLDSLTASVLYQNGDIYVKNAEFSGSNASKNSLVNLSPEIDFKTGISYQGTLSGSLSNFQGNLGVMLTKPEFKNFAWDNGNVEITFAEGKAQVHRLTLRKDSLIIQATGQYKFSPPWGYLEVRVGSTSIPVDSLFYSSVDHFIDPTTGLITVIFSQDSTQSWLVKAEGNKIQLQKILSVYKKKIKGKGRFNFKLTASGNDQDLSGKLNFQAYSLGMYKSTLDSIKGTVKLQANQLTLRPLLLYTRGNKSEAEIFFELTREQTGGYILNRESKIQGQARGTNLDLQFIPPLLGLDIEVSGSSNYSLQWKGKWGRPQLQGHLRVENGTLRLGPEAQTIRSMQINLSLSDSLLLINPIAGITGDSPFQLQGKITGNWNRKFQAYLQLDTENRKTFILEGIGTPDSLHLHSRINNLSLSLMRNFISGMQKLDGQLQGQISLSGPLSNPRILGTLNATNLTVQPHILNTPFTNGIVKIIFKNDKIFLDSLYVSKDKGSITARGNTAYSEGKITDLKVLIKGKGVKINRPHELKLAFKNINMQLRKEQDEYFLSGDIFLGESTLLRDIEPKAVISFFQKVERPLPTPPQLFQKTRLQVRVQESKKIWINNNIARLRLHPELTFIGTLASPNLTGRISVEEGYILYLDRKFEIEQGVLDFTNPYSINPIVDFKAQADIKNYQTISKQEYVISLGIQGPLDQAGITLSSQPPLEKSDIITILTVGATRKELTGSDKSGKSSIGMVLEERLGQISSSQVTGFASRKIGNVFNLKDMSIQGNLFRFGESWGPRLVASKAITDRMNITYSTRVGHSNDQSIHLDYRITPNLSIDSQTDQKGKAGIDLKFQWKFK